ncbi:MAG: hypothetical protein ACM3NH_03175 [Candidatus Saccharibacteria bacterium]
MDVSALPREELVKRVLWNSGGMGFGICAMANSMAWGLDRPGPDNPDWISIVAVSGAQESYTDEELRKIADFAEKVTARYDRLFSCRRGANVYLLKKWDDGTWMRKRLTWTQGAMYSRTLDEALRHLAPELFSQEGEEKKQ